MNNSKRKHIKNLTQLPPLEFVSNMKYIKKYLDGIISNKFCDISEKVDGISVKFGMTKDGRFFMESATSGMQFEPKSFSKILMDKHGKSSEIMDALDDVFEMLSTDKYIIELLSQYKNGIKLITELCYPLLDKEDGCYVSRFVTVSYDSKFFPLTINFILIKAIDENEVEYPYDEIISKFNILILMRDCKLHDWNPINLSKEIENVINYVDNIENFEYIIKSRKKIDKELKDNIISNLLEHQNIITKKLLNNVNRGLFGKDYEGIVFQLNENIIFKVCPYKFYIDKEKYRKEFEK